MGIYLFLFQFVTFCVLFLKSFWYVKLSHLLSELILLSYVMSLFIVANTPGSEVGFDSQSCSLISVSDFPHPFTLLCLHTECWFLDDSLQLALLPWLTSQAAPSWVAHLGLRLRRLAIPEDGEQLFPRSSSKCLEVLTGPARVTCPLRTSPGGQGVDYAHGQPGSQNQPRARWG